MAQGKTCWEIAKILSISEHTARGYIKTAYMKLGVHDKTCAVIKALSQRLIAPEIVAPKTTSSM
jgi:DNA-binding CsgD family transcriptional regulator